MERDNVPNTIEIKDQARQQLTVLLANFPFIKDMGGLTKSQEEALEDSRQATVKLAKIIDQL